MKQFKCPECKRVREFYENTVMKICKYCQVEMEVIEECSGQ